MNDDSITFYSDRDWTGYVAERNSATGLLINIYSTSFLCRTMKEYCVALSFTGADYISICDISKTIIWIRCLVKELECNSVNPTEPTVGNPVVLHEDNHGSIH